MDLLFHRIVFRNTSPGAVPQPAPRPPITHRIYLQNRFIQRAHCRPSRPLLSPLFLRIVLSLYRMIVLPYEKALSGVRVESHWNHTGVRVESWHPHS